MRLAVIDRVHRNEASQEDNEHLATDIFNHSSVCLTVCCTTAGIRRTDGEEFLRRHDEHFQGFPSQARAGATKKNFFRLNGTELESYMNPTEFCSHGCCSAKSDRNGHTR